MRTLDFLLVFICGLILDNATCQFTKNDKQFYKKLYEKTLKHSTDLQDVTYSLIGLKSLSVDVEKEKIIDVCQKVNEIYNNELMSVPALFYLSLVNKAHPNCKIAPHANSEKFLKDRFLDQKSPMSLYEIYKAQTIFNYDAKKEEVYMHMKEALLKEPSINDLAYFLKFASENINEMEIEYVKNQIESILSQSDEVDGKYLQYEGGVAITGLIIDVLFKLSTQLTDYKIFNEDKALKFAQYLLFHKSQINTKNAFYVYKALKAMSNSKSAITIIVEPHFDFGQAISASKPSIKISVSDIMGKTISGDHPLHITGKLSSYSEPQNKDLTWTTALKPISAPPGSLLNGKNIWYEINLMELNLPTTTTYNLAFDIQAPSTEKTYYGLRSQKKVIKVTKEVSIQEFTAQVVDKDHGTNVQKINLREGEKYSSILNVDSQNKLIMNFVVKEKLSGEDCLIQQAFVKFENKKTKHQVIFVAEPKASTTVYEFDLNLGGKGAKEFNSQSGDYSIELLIGDSFVSNPTRWNMIDCHVTFPQTKDVATADTARLDKKQFVKKPEIRHLFKVPEKRPPKIVSLVFSILTILPALFMVGLWLKLGVNFSKFKISMWAIIFHSSLAAVFFLYTLFWLKLNMFQTLRYMTMIGPILFYSGSRLLRHLADQRKKGDN